MTPYTTATERIRATIPFAGMHADAVFDLMGDPERITDWFILAKEVRMHPTDEAAFNVVFTFFGDVYEEVLHWDPPRRYVYLAQGPDFPIQDYVARIEVEETGDGTGVVRWAIHYDVIEGEAFQRVLPVMLPPVIEESLLRLARLIGGDDVEMVVSM
jgi:uncharacterized protein YndB with AHSA1/START domain